ncbi:hypothetical protein GCM10027073_15390 [Streptomyces chlorus]
MPGRDTSTGGWSANSPSPPEESGLSNALPPGTDHSDIDAAPCRETRAMPARRAGRPRSRQLGRFGTAVVSDPRTSAACCSRDPSPRALIADLHGPRGPAGTGAGKEAEQREAAPRSRRGRGLKAVESGVGEDHRQVVVSRAELRRV